MTKTKRPVIVRVSVAFSSFFLCVYEEEEEEDEEKHVDHLSIYLFTLIKYRQGFILCSLSSFQNIYLIDR